MAVRLLLVLLLSSSFSWAQSQCVNLFDDHQLLLDRKSLVNQDLIEIYNAEVDGKTAAEVADMNLKTIESIQNEIPFKTTSTRAVEISEATAKKLVNLTYENPVVSPGLKKYDPQNIMGFCFGRATFTHLMLLKMGVQKNSIRKIWAIGPMQTGEINWRYHVATMVYTNTKGWLVLDTNHGAPVTPQEWMATYSKMSADGKLRFYSSDASKFAFMMGKYSRLQLGMDNEQERDYYRGYFKDMMEWVRKRKLSEDGIVSLDKSKEKNSIFNTTMSNMWTSIVEFLR